MVAWLWHDEREITLKSTGWSVIKRSIFSAEESEVHYYGENTMTRFAHTGKRNLLFYS